MLNKKTPISAGIALILGLGANYALATEHVTVVDPDTHLNKEGTVTFDDWGFVGPNGRTAVDFEPVNGFNFDSVGQIQHVVTRAEDGLTPDDPVTVIQDLYGTPIYGSADMDGTVSFYHWAYTTKGGSTFYDMLIDTDGDYFIPQEGMTFIRYDVHEHNSALNPGDTDYVADGSYPTKIAFQPYVLSDARGWCGSISAANPGALEPMAGQLQFDFAFDVYFQFTPGVFQYSSTEIVRNFEMRSYGTLTIDIDNIPSIASDPQFVKASAVVNNTNPGINNLQVAGAPVDPDYYNLVSFMGGGVLDNAGHCMQLNPNFVGGGGLTGTSNYKFTGFVDGPTDQASCETAGGTWQLHAFTGYAFVLRADGIRVIEAMDYALYSDLTDVPTVIPDPVSLADVAYNNDETLPVPVSIPIADITATPDAFTFTDNVDVSISSLSYSNTLPLAGLVRETVITVTGGEYNINGGAYTSDRGVVIDGDSIRLRTTSSGIFNTAVDAVLTVGSVSDTFTVTAEAEDGTPDAFSFIDQTVAPLNTPFISNVVSVNDINTSVQVSVTGGQYRINGGAFQSIDGVVVAGDQIEVEVTSSNAELTTVSATVTIGGVADTFSVTTAGDTDGDGIIDVDDNCIEIANADQLDTDLDMYGNACDADFNNDGFTNSLDTGLFKAEFYTTGSVDTDINGDSIVNSLDIGLYKQRFSLAPGPSGLIP